MLMAGADLVVQDLPGDSCVRDAPRLVARDALRAHMNGLDRPVWSTGQRRTLNAFVDLAAAKGYPAVTMRILGLELNVKPPTIYSYFPGGRDEIVAEALRWACIRFGEQILAAVDDTDDAAGFLDAVARCHVRLQLQYPEGDMWDSMLAADEREHLLQPEVRRQVDRCLQLYANMYEAAAGELGYDRSARALRLVMTMLDAATVWCAWDGSDEGLELHMAQGARLTHALLALRLPVEPVQAGNGT